MVAVKLPLSTQVLHDLLVVLVVIPPCLVVVHLLGLVVLISLVLLIQLFGLKLVVFVSYLTSLLQALNEGVEVLVLLAQNRLVLDRLLALVHAIVCIRRLLILVATFLLEHLSDALLQVLL